MAKRKYLIHTNHGLKRSDELDVGGSGGATNYNDLTNKPVGNATSEVLTSEFNNLYDETILAHSFGTIIINGVQPGAGTITIKNTSTIPWPVGSFIRGTIIWFSLTTISISTNIVSLSGNFSNISSFSYANNSGFCYYSFNCNNTVPIDNNNSEILAQILNQDNYPNRNTFFTVVIDLRTS